MTYFLTLLLRSYRFAAGLMTDNLGYDMKLAINHFYPLARV